ncbi:MAG: hypothetical protein NVSMB47_10090 [Polyangiales bacterium]
MDTHARATLNEQLRRLADGDRSAFEPAYAALWPVVRAFCRRVLSEADAEDAAQLALLKVFDRAAAYDVRRDALPWVLAIASWECRTLRRRHARRREADPVALEVAFDAAASPETAVIDADLSAALTEALGGLTALDRETLEQTMTDEAPAAVAGATFRKRRERALARLQAAWRRVYGD